ncbi:DgyrCDS9131 [Dimorphilus gyrociliatus]|nr:DgyrCDS9131 [Dimorphilus gyrociliatus]
MHPFPNQDKNFFSRLLSELSTVTTNNKVKRVLFMGVFITFSIILLLVWCNSTNSIALTAYTYLGLFDLFSLATCVITIWSEKQQPNSTYTFGYDRFEVLAVFATTLLAQLGALFIVKESVERLILQPDVHTGRLLVATILAFVVHMATTYCVNNPAFNHVVSASSSSWLQEHTADFSHSICKIAPGLSKLLLPRINPFSLIAFAGASAIIGVYFIVDSYNYTRSDTWAALWIALMTVGTMFPMTMYTGTILLQTTPGHVLGQIDKCLREASTLDGVLEFQHEHCWSVGFKGMAGSMHVRVRRDADEQLVLAHVVNRLSDLVPNLTVQIFKDDWTRPTARQIISQSPNFASPTLFPYRPSTSPQQLDTKFNGRAPGSFDTQRIA